MTLEKAKQELEKFVQLKTTLRPAFVDVLLNAEEVKHGHWDNKIIDARFDVPHTVARCSNCKGKIWVYAENYVVKYPYCPLCGAKMDEVEDGSSDN